MAAQTPTSAPRQNARPARNPRSRFGRVLFATLLALGLAPPAVRGVEPLVGSHSHNDYLQQRPLADALALGFTSVEADVFLVGEQLYVAHTPLGIRPGKTLEALYLAPLKERVAAHGGRVYRKGPTLTLLVDVKTDPTRTYAVLRPLLARYRTMLSAVVEGRAKPGAVQVVLSGRGGPASLEKETTRLVALDGHRADLESRRPAHWMPLISESWSGNFAWRGAGPMPEDQRRRLRTFVQQAHQSDRRVRFWGTPDEPSVWRELTAAGVDLIAADDLARLAKYLREDTPE